MRFVLQVHDPERRSEQRASSTSTNIVTIVSLPLLPTCLFEKVSRRLQDLALSAQLARDAKWSGQDGHRMPHGLFCTKHTSGWVPRREWGG